jgi:decaprenylphospho-beta-D-ribofuranose 2-oxidase
MGSTLAVKSPRPQEDNRTDGQEHKGQPVAETQTGEGCLLTGWGRTAATRATVSHPPSDLDVVGQIQAYGKRGLIPRGLGRAYGDAAQNAGGGVLSTDQIDAVRSVDVNTGRVTVGAGISLDTLMRLFLPLGWFVSVTPGTRYVTVGGAIASDIHGKNHHLDGSFCNHVVSFELVTPTGERLTAAPDAEPDVFWATAGGMGLTGVIVEATLQLLPVETSFTSVDTERARDLDDLMQRMAEGDVNYRYSVAWIDCLTRGRTLGRAVLTRGDHARRDQLDHKQRANPLRFDTPRVVDAPDWFPPGLLNYWSVRAFNEVLFRKAPRTKTQSIESIHSFFHPLDGVAHWNRMYGRHGFLQYQFVVPFGCEGVVQRIVERLSTERCPSFLGVLKRFGQGNGLLSFPVSGWTLAIDIPASIPGLAPLLDEFDQLVASSGGRVYLSKDSRLRPELMEVMYPEFARWQRIQRQLDPQGVMRSDLARRLQLV